jgi:hypothetical protein
MCRADDRIDPLEFLGSVVLDPGLGIGGNDFHFGFYGTEISKPAKAQAFGDSIPGRKEPRFVRGSFQSIDEILEHVPDRVWLETHDL